MVLTNKVILVISSEPWGRIFISKHHYAYTLAELGNKVYFLNPPDSRLRRGELTLDRSAQHHNLYIISYRPLFPWLIKFHAKWLFNILIGVRVKKILKKLKTRFDIVWDFNCSYLYNDLSVFKANLNIFHPVDKLSADTIYKKADILFSVSPLILGEYKVPGVPKFLINHGLSKRFGALAAQAPAPVNYTGKKIKACYIGNLLIPSLDREIIREIIISHTNVDFIFIGPYNNTENNIAGGYNPEDEIFISFLQGCSNVTLTGILSTEKIAEEINKFDVFLICYKNSQHYRSDNSHKVLEYLSTGKVIVSTPLLFYQDSDLLEMNRRDRDYNSLFTEVTGNLDYYNSVERMSRRKTFAKNNTYEKHIKDIESLINAHVVK